MSLIDGRGISAGGHQPLGGVEDQLARLLALLLFLRRSLICRDHYRQTSNPANVRPLRISRTFCTVSPRSPCWWHAEAVTVHTDVTTDELLGLFPPGNRPRRRRHPGRRGVPPRRGRPQQFGTPAIVVVRRRPASAGPRLPRRVPRPMAALRRGVRVKVVPVHRRSAGDGRRGPAPRRGGRRRDPHRARRRAPIRRRLVLHGNAKTDEEVDDGGRATASA